MRRQNGGEERTLLGAGETTPRRQLANCTDRRRLETDIRSPCWQAKRATQRCGRCALLAYGNTLGLTFSRARVAAAARLLHDCCPPAPRTQLHDPNARLNGDPNARLNGASDSQSATSCSEQLTANQSLDSAAHNNAAALSRAPALLQHKAYGSRTPGRAVRLARGRRWLGMSGDGGPRHRGRASR